MLTCHRGCSQVFAFSFGLHTLYYYVCCLQILRLSSERRLWLSKDSLVEALQVTKNVTSRGQELPLPDSYNFYLFTAKETSPIFQAYDALSKVLQGRLLSCMHIQTSLSAV